MLSVAENYIPFEKQRWGEGGRCFLQEPSLYGLQGWQGEPEIHRPAHQEE